MSESQQKWTPTHDQIMDLMHRLELDCADPHINPKPNEIVERWIEDCQTDGDVSKVACVTHDEIVRMTREQFDRMADVLLSRKAQKEHA